jgi:pyridoxal 5'-phosphate synthase pdxT subunit
MRIVCGVLALQGDFSLHVCALAKLGVAAHEVRKPADLAGLTHIVLPGGESTTLYKLGTLYGVLEPLASAVKNGLAAFGTCAGAILLGQGPPPPPRLNLVPVTVVRNAYGRQKESFTAELAVPSLGAPVPGVFIRAPKLVLPPVLPPGLEVLGRCGAEPVMVKYGKVLLATFHPELTDDTRVHRLFLAL